MTTVQAMGRFGPARPFTVPDEVAVVVARGTGPRVDSRPGARCHHRAVGTSAGRAARNALRSHWPAEVDTMGDIVFVMTPAPESATSFAHRKPAGRDWWFCGHGLANRASLHDIMCRTSRGSGRRLKDVPRFARDWPGDFCCFFRARQASMGGWTRSAAIIRIMPVYRRTSRRVSDVACTGADVTDQPRIRGYQARWCCRTLPG